jgi:hypothetical protein
MKHLIVLLALITTLALTSCGPEYKSNQTYDELYNNYNENYESQKDDNTTFWAIVILIAGGVAFVAWVDSKK